MIDGCASANATGNVLLTWEQRVLINRRNETVTTAVLNNDYAAEFVNDLAALVDLYFEHDAAAAADVSVLKHTDPELYEALASIDALLQDQPLIDDSKQAYYEMHSQSWSISDDPLCDNAVLLAQHVEETSYNFNDRVDGDDTWHELEMRGPVFERAFIAINALADHYEIF